MIIDKNTPCCFIVAFPKGFKINSLELCKLGGLHDVDIIKDSDGLNIKKIFKTFKRNISLLRKNGVIYFNTSSRWCNILVEYCNIKGFLIDLHIIDYLDDTNNLSTIIDISSSRSKRNRIKKISDTY